MQWNHQTVGIKAEQKGRTALSLHALIEIDLKISLTLPLPQKIGLGMDVYKRI